MYGWEETHRQVLAFKFRLELKVKMHNAAQCGGRSSDCSRG